MKQVPDIPAYAELWCQSNFSFMHGASHPHELVERAQQLGYSALAITDECSLSGIVRAYEAAREAGLHLLVGAQFQVQGNTPFTLIVLARTMEGYGNLCAFITGLRRSADKGSYSLTQDAIDPAALADCVVLLAPARSASQAALIALGHWLQQSFPGRCWLTVCLLRELGDEMWLYRMRQLARHTMLPLVAAGNVHMHVRSRKPLQDVLTAIRIGRPLAECGHALQPNAERHLRSRLRLAQIYPPDLLAETQRVAAACTFRLDALRYEYPDEVVPAGATPTAYLKFLVKQGAAQRWPAGVSDKVRQMLAHELALIAELRYEHYFLTVHDIVRFARSRGILCQGRGSAANSVVCYCLAVTEVDPERSEVLFERFISRERNEPPDIDIDFEHERREEVMQYLYDKYGRHRAGLTAVVITYRSKSAMRDVCKALGIPGELLDRLARNYHRRDGIIIRPEVLADAGLSPDDWVVRQLGALTHSLIGFPRHLSQHVGGFVLTGGPLSRMVPIENAAMPGRTVIQWDKDDLDALGMLKVDILALGMLTALRKALELVGQRLGRRFVMQDIPAEDPLVYDMLCRADVVGVFQIESRAQMSMLPRLRPRCFYDLVIEVAIVRPGPIQGGMVHPYLRRRQGKEPVVYPGPALEQALGRTLGVPIFQEQVMQLSMLAAGFTPGEADGLRRSMAAWRRKGGVEKYYDRLIHGMVRNGYERAFAESVFEQIKGFSEYGFPESHSASFALLVYASSWLKCHYPAEFLAAMLNSQPLGFYTPWQLVQDARRHGVQVLPVDVQCSAVDCTLEDVQQVAAVRLGMCMVRGLSQATAGRIVAARLQAPFESADALARRCALTRDDLQLLAAADALASLAGHRRQQVWQASAWHAAPALLREAPVHEVALALPPAPEGEDILWDHSALGLSLRRHPVALLRPRLQKRQVFTAEQLRQIPDGQLVRHVGIVTTRQQPPAAKGTAFVTLEDETGSVQVICWKSLYDAQRAELLHSRLMGVYGRWQREGLVCHLVALRLVDLTHLLGRLATTSRDFH